MPAVSARLFSQNTTPWYLTVSPVGVLGPGPTRPSGDVFFEGQAVYWFQVTSPDGRPWYVSPANGGEDLLIAPLQPAIGPGSVNLIPFRDAAGVAWFLAVSNAGVLSVSMDIESVFQPSLQDQDAFYCWRHHLVYRPDPRIYPLSTTHCPIDNSPLVSWKDFINGREGDYDSPGEYFEEAYY